jgi:serine/threonine protein kinase
MSAAPEDSLPLPHRLAGTPYELLQLLGAGAMGSVYVAMHTDLRRHEVVKILHGKHAQRGEIIGRFRQEARLASQLAHPALPVIYGLGTTPLGQHWIAMERLHGEDLRAHLRRVGTVPYLEAVDLVAQALDGLAVAHGAGILHRDIKPENLFRTADRRIKVLDFGIAKPLEDQQATGVNTAFGMVLGTPRYMSPEQAKGHPLGPATDLYAVGCVLFELIAGSPLVQGNDSRELLRQHVYGTPQSLWQRTGQRFDPRIEAIIARAVAKEASARFRSAQEMSLALRALVPGLGERTGGSVPPSAFDPNARVADKETVRVDSVPPVAALPTAMQPSYGPQSWQPLPPAPHVPTEATRNVPPQSLVVGVMTTEQRPTGPASFDPRRGILTAPTAAMTVAPGPGHTAPTERLGTGTVAMPTPPPAAAPRLPPGVIDYSLSSEALARELSGSSRTTAATRRTSPLLVVGGGAALVGLLVLASVGLGHMLRGGGERGAASANVERANAEAVASAAAGPSATPPADPSAASGERRSTKLGAGDAIDGPTAGARDDRPTIEPAGKPATAGTGAATLDGRRTTGAGSAGGVPAIAWSTPKELLPPHPSATGTPAATAPTAAAPVATVKDSPPAPTSRKRKTEAAAESSRDD